ncbi:MAG: 3-oxoacyl-[acyl-carrier-protein] reductase [Minwuia sp.]|uniref:3-oxoacyl-[acyl-carrier-protein] reductase n=1 Tax=Minwuia sp. TaxID=2493630 RepID=UPI003A86C4D4
MFDLTGKTALVTGASGGIGRAVAETLHAAGATVGLHGTREAVLQEVAASLGDRTHVLPANLGEPGAAAELAKAAEAAMGQVDILVNNAGITRDNLAMRLKDEDWDAVINVNLNAGFQLAKALLRGMMKRRHGRIVSITSIVGTTGNPGQTNYAAAKAGTVGWTKSLAAEVASRGITVNCLAPGFIATAMTDALGDDQKAKLNEAIPAGRMGTGGDIAAGVLYLASDEAAYVTGQTLHINGGMAMI